MDQIKIKIQYPESSDSKPLVEQDQRVEQVTVHQQLNNKQTLTHNRQHLLIHLLKHLHVQVFNAVVFVTARQVPGAKDVMADMTRANVRVQLVSMEALFVIVSKITPVDFGYTQVLLFV